MKILIFLLLLSSSVYCQTIDTIENNTIMYNGNNYPTCFFNWGSSSSSRPVMVLITDIKNYDLIKERIPKIYFSKKQEYTDYYLIGVNDMKSNIEHTDILNLFLTKIDEYRKKTNLSTFLIEFKYDQQIKKIIYLDTFRNLKDIIGTNVYFLDSPGDICKYMICRK